MAKHEFEIAVADGLRKFAERAIARGDKSAIWNITSVLFRQIGIAMEPSADTAISGETLDALVDIQDEFLERLCVRREKWRKAKDSTGKPENPKDSTGKPENPSTRAPLPSSQFPVPISKFPNTSARRGDSRPLAPAQAPARTREERPGGQPPEPPAPRREISSQDSQSPEEPPGTPEERAEAREAIERALGIEDRTGRKVTEEWEWHVRDPVEAVRATFGAGPWGKWRSALGNDRFLDIAETYWRECRAGEHADVKNHAAVLTTRFKEVLR